MCKQNDCLVTIYTVLLKYMSLVSKTEHDKA